MIEQKSLKPRCRRAVPPKPVHRGSPWGSGVGRSVFGRSTWPQLLRRRYLVKQRRYGDWENHWKFTGQAFGQAWGMKRGSGWLEDAHRSRGGRACLQVRHPAGPVAGRAGSSGGFGRRVGRQAAQPGKVGQCASTGAKASAGVEVVQGSGRGLAPKPLSRGHEAHFSGAACRQLVNERRRHERVTRLSRTLCRERPATVDLGREESQDCAQRTDPRRQDV